MGNFFDYYFIYLILTCLLLGLNKGHSLPSYITPCNRSDTNIHKCVEANINKIRPYLKEGIPDLFIPPLDPLVIPTTGVNEKDRVKVTFTDIRIYHVDEFHLERFDIDLENHEVNITINFPYLRIKSTYNVNGKFLVVTFDEKGPADGNYSNFKVNLGLKGSPYMEKEQLHLRWDTKNISIEVKNSHIILEKLFGNHTDIADKTNKVINENINAIINDLQPLIQKVVGNFIFGVVNKLFSEYSIKDLFTL